MNLDAILVLIIGAISLFIFKQSGSKSDKSAEIVKRSVQDITNMNTKEKLDALKKLITK